MLPLKTLNLTWTIRTPSYLHLPAIALAQARRAGPTITSIVDEQYPEGGLLPNFLKWRLGLGG